jgi:hypothetical protein
MPAIAPPSGFSQYYQNYQFPNQQRQQPNQQQPN